MPKGVKLGAVEGEVESHLAREVEEIKGKLVEMNARTISSVRALSSCRLRCRRMRYTCSNNWITW